MRNWISVDIETTGLDPTVHEVIEVGLCAANYHETEFSLAFDESKADPVALEVNGWGQRDFAPQLELPDALGVLQGAFGGGALIVASPAHFDVPFLEALFRRQGMRPPWSHRSVIDIKTFACAKWGVLTDLRNDEIARMLDVEPLELGDAHNALNDARWQAQLFRALIA